MTNVRISIDSNSQIADPHAAARLLSMKSFAVSAERKFLGIRLKKIVHTSRRDALRYQEVPLILCVEPLQKVDQLQQDAKSTNPFGSPSVSMHQ